MKRILYILLGLIIIFLGWEYLLSTNRSNFEVNFCGGNLGRCPLGSYCKSPKNDSLENSMSGYIVVDVSTCTPIIDFSKNKKTDTLY